MSAKSVTRRSNALIHQTFGVANEEALRQCLTDRFRAQEYKEVITSKIRDLAQRLATPLDAPSWGPHGRKHKDAQWRSRAQATLSAADSARLIPPVQREAIVENLERSHRYASFSGLYLLFVVLALLVAGSALFVDYQIMTEFWTRALANEFMEVPTSLATSVVSKSLQVVFATVAFHFLLSRLPEFGRVIFIVLFFALTFAMVAGFGFLNARMSLPHDMGAVTSESDGGQGGSLGAALSSLGLGQTAQPDEASSGAVVSSADGTTPVSAQDMRQIEWMTWLVSPGIVFLIVTGIGALCLHGAGNNVQNFVKSRDYHGRKRRIEELDMLERLKATIDRYLSDERQSFTQPELVAVVPANKIAAFKPRSRP